MAPNKSQMVLLLCHQTLLHGAELLSCVTSVRSTSATNSVNTPQISLYFNYQPSSQSMDMYILHFAEAGSIFKTALVYSTIKMLGENLEYIFFF